MYCSYIAQISENKLEIGHFDHTLVVLVSSAEMDQSVYINNFVEKCHTTCSGPTIPRLRVSNLRLVEAASGCAPSVEVLPISDVAVNKAECGNTAKMRAPTSLAGSRPMIPQLRVSNLRLVDAASGCAPSVEVLPISDVAANKAECGNTAKMRAPTSLAGSVWVASDLWPQSCTFENKETFGSSEIFRNTGLNFEANFNTEGKITPCFSTEKLRYSRHKYLFKDKPELCLAYQFPRLNSCEISPWNKFAGIHISTSILGLTQLNIQELSHEYRLTELSSLFRSNAVDRSFTL
ncbi:hypothetical protein WN51_00328 [Melipona quadrifasciata]|uniref:Uncharacterized protein n=1 Tax=Melipona quadrifasciata TaxID=166423 RepID=A0A0M8ZXZ2_9HYME|nr:hypothetical protein WN51_00328 [Melipona quadrifasciata]